MSAARERAVAYVLGTYLGYTETFLYQQMRSLSRWEAVVLCSKLENTERFPWPGPRVVASGHAPKLARVVGGWPGLELQPAWLDAIDRHRVSVLHGQYGPYGLLAALYARKRDVPLVVSFYGYDVGYLERWRQHLRTHWDYVLGRFILFRTADIVLALSSAMRDDLVRLGCPAGKVRVHPNGVSLTRFAPVERASREGPITVVMCGRQEEKKGFEFGLRAVRRAIDQGADLRVRWLVAPGAWADKVAPEIASLGLSSRVEVLDPSHDPAALMASGDVILAPSVTASTGDKEGVPTVLVEAAAAGLPAVASLHAGIPEIVADGRTGLLFPERDVEGLASGLVRLASDRALRLGMGEAARRVAAATYDAGALATRLEGYYDALARPSRLA